VFSGLFRRAEASVDNAVGELGNRVLIAIPFVAAVGFVAASLWLVAARTYGPEIGNLMVAGGFFLLGCFFVLIVKVRSRNGALETETEREPSASGGAATGPDRSMFEDENLMGIVTAAAPVVFPVLLRTASKNWPIVLAIAAGLYVFSRPSNAAASVASSAKT
jgi:hypothetical protein